MIYLDNAATTYPKPESVYSAMDDANRRLAVNAGRGSYKLAREASLLIADTKKKLRELINVESDSPVVFTPSITIALNEIINGIGLNQGDYVYVSPFEHNAVARTIHRIERKKGIKVKQIPISSENYEVDVEKTKYEFSRNKPKAVFCTHISNVVGYILPIEAIFEEAKKYNAITVLDTAQSLGLIPIEGSRIGADIIAFAGHKCLYGPIGIGGFFNIGHVALEDSIVGGTGSDSLNLEMPNGIESKYESSSMNIVAIAGLNAALMELNQEEIFNNEVKMTQYAVSKLMKIPKITVFTPDPKNHIGVISFVIKGYTSEDIGVILDEDYDIAVRTGYHCAPWIHEHLDDMKTLGTVRIGMGRYTKKEDIDALIDALTQL